jgi:hypothetical protein
MKPNVVDDIISMIYVEIWNYDYSSLAFWFFPLQINLHVLFIYIYGIKSCLF